MFTELVAGRFWSSERPLWFGGVRLRSRTTVLRLDDGALWVHSACEPTEEACAALDRLGEVRWIVVPNKFHHIHAPAMRARYPQAKVVAPRSALARNQRLEIDIDIDDPALGSALPELESLALTGVAFLDETLFFHRATGTLVGADTMMCGCARDHWTWRLTARVLGQYDRHRAPPDVRWNTRPSAELDASLQRITALPIDRILVAHSDPIEDRPSKQLAEAWRFARR